MVNSLFQNPSLLIFKHYEIAKLITRQVSSAITMLQQSLFKNFADEFLHAASQYNLSATFSSEGGLLCQTQP